MTQRRVR